MSLNLGNYRFWRPRLLLGRGSLLALTRSRVSKWRWGGRREDEVALSFAFEARKMSLLLERFAGVRLASTREWSGVACCGDSVLEWSASSKAFAAGPGTASERGAQRCLRCSLASLKPRENLQVLNAGN